MALDSMEHSRNPFRYGSDFDPDDIVARKEEMARTVTAVTRPRKFLPVGTGVPS